MLAINNYRVGRVQTHSLYQNWFRLTKDHTHVLVSLKDLQINRQAKDSYPTLSKAASPWAAPLQIAALPNPPPRRRNS